MKKISLLEFRDYCMAHHFNKIIFSSENQNHHSVDSSIYASILFDTMMITFNPNIIHLRDKHNNYLRLSRVKTVKILEESSLLGEVITITCGGLLSNNYDKEYTLVMQV